MSEHPFTIVVQSADTIAPVIAHVPYASAVIPSEVREGIELSDAELDESLRASTDWHLDELFDWMFEFDAPLFLGEYSRLAFDPDDPDSRTSQFWGPYHDGLSALATMLEGQFGFCIILDLRTFATEPNPGGPGVASAGPDVCIGISDALTPSKLADSLQTFLREEGFRVEAAGLCTGTFVPAGLGASAPWVKSVRIALRRGLYCDEATGEKNGDFEDVKERIKRAVSVAVAEATGRLDHERRNGTD